MGYLDIKFSVSLLCLLAEIKVYFDR